MWYSYDENLPVNIACLPIETVKEIIEINSKGEKVKKLESVDNTDVTSILEYVNVGSEESLTRFEDAVSENSQPRKNKYRRRKN